MHAQPGTPVRTVFQALLRGVAGACGTSDRYVVFSAAFDRPRLQSNEQGRVVYFQALFTTATYITLSVPIVSRVAHGEGIHVESVIVGIRLFRLR